jgi:hypothetical protein
MRNNFISRKASLEGAKDYFPIPDIATKAILKHTTLTNKVVDIGCGSGIATRVAMKQGYDVIPIDLIDRGCENVIIQNFFDPNFSGFLVENGIHSTISLMPYNMSIPWIKKTSSLVMNGIIEHSLLFGCMRHLSGVKRTSVLQKARPDIYILGARLPGYTRKSGFVTSREDNIWMHFYPQSEGKITWIGISSEERKESDARFRKEIGNG